jgi:hypothetical protein
LPHGLIRPGGLGGWGSAATPLTYELRPGSCRGFLMPQMHWRETLLVAAVSVLMAAITATVIRLFVEFPLDGAQSPRYRPAARLPAYPLDAA